MADEPSAWRRRLLGDGDSWRRIVVYGVGAGVALAFVGALIAAAIGDSGSGSLDPATPVPIATSDVPVDTPVIIDTPVLSPTPPPVEQPTDVPPTEVPPTEPRPPTDAPPAEPPPTDAPPTEPPVDTPVA